MASNSNRARKTTRFSLLLLEHGEVLLSDLAVQYHFVSSSPLGSALHPLCSYPERFAVRSANSSIRGRVKVGTHNIFFDSDDWRDPVIRIPLLSVDLARPTRDNSRSRGSDDDITRPTLSDDPEDENSVLVIANSAIFQRELGTDHPYIDVQLKGKHIFTPLYTSALTLLDEITSLLHITVTQSRRSRDASLRALVREREARVPFDITLLEHGTQEVAMMDAAASAVYSMARAPGRFRITEQNVYFMPIHGESTQTVERISTKHITSVRRLHHGCRDAALELGFRKLLSSNQPDFQSTLMVSFESTKVREKSIEILLHVVGTGVEMYDRRELETALSKWRIGEMSNFDYLMYVNMAAGRSFNDLSQYPVFPWVLKDFDSDVLDLNDESSFRDLSLPIGAQNPERLETFKERYCEMPAPRFFYGTHYSTPAYTINYLVRAAPAAMLRLQNGKFDTPDRLFHSVSNTWKGVFSNQSDVKELIPEFYAIDYSAGNASGVVSSASCPGEFLDNVLNLDLGSRQDGKRVDDVELPPWANGSSELFVRHHREALESDYVSSNLHKWIDLIFGVKSRNAEAFNVFYTDVALPSSINQTKASKLSEEEMSQIETIYLEFGRTPERMFGHPHPPRYGDIHSNAFDLHDRPDVDPQAQNHAPGQNQATEAGTNLQKGTELPLDISSLIANENEITVGGAEKNCLSNLRRSTNFWGSHSRLRDSILKGASDPILFPFEPPSGETGSNDEQQVLKPCLAKVISSTHVVDNSSVIIDVCLVQDEIHFAEETESSSVCAAEIPAVCTMWNDGNLKVHSKTKMLRSKNVGDPSSVTYISSGIIGFGTLTGNIGLYYIDSGRAEVVVPAAHDAEIFALEYVERGNVLLSGSKDASVKVWRFRKQNHRAGSLQLFQELDAESCIDGISGTTHEIGPVSGNSVEKNLLVAASTTDGQLIAWDVDLLNKNQSFLEPIWRSEVDLAGTEWNECSTREIQTLTWLYQGQSRKHALVSVHRRENCVRVWNLDQTRMAAAELFLPKGDVICVASCNASRTVLVGGRAGQISEYDSTGLCLGKVVAGANDVRKILVPIDGGCIYVFGGRDNVLQMIRRH